MKRSNDLWRFACSDIFDHFCVQVYVSACLPCVQRSIHHWRVQGICQRNSVLDGKAINSENGRDFLRHNSGEQSRQFSKSFWPRHAQKLFWTNSAKLTNVNFPNVYYFESFVSKSLFSGSVTSKLSQFC